MILFLLLVIAAIGLGVAGMLVSGLFYLLIIGVAVLIADFIYMGARLGRGQRPAR